MIDARTRGATSSAMGSTEESSKASICSLTRIAASSAATPEPMRVAALGRAVIEGLRLAGVVGIVKHMPGHGRGVVDSHLDGPVVVRADSDRLHQAVGNLLANAARYCRPGDRVRVAVRPEGRDAVLEVVDSGPGIAADELPHVFERLWRGRSAREVAGSGIGLAVAREIVTAHGGTIEATSREGAGTTITIRLPRRPASRREP